MWEAVHSEMLDFKFTYDVWGAVASVRAMGEAETVLFRGSFKEWNIARRIVDNSLIRALVFVEVLKSTALQPEFATSSKYTRTLKYTRAHWNINGRKPICLWSASGPFPTSITTKWAVNTPFTIPYSLIRDSLVFIDSTHDPLFWQSHLSTWPPRSSNIRGRLTYTRTD